MVYLSLNHFWEIQPVEEFLETRVNFGVVIGTNEAVTQQKTFGRKIYNVLRVKLGKICNRKWHKESQSGKNSQYLMPPFF